MERLGIDFVGDSRLARDITTDYGWAQIGEEGLE
jgi:hypothetical protein